MQVFFITWHFCQVFQILIIYYTIAQSNETKLGRDYDSWEEEIQTYVNIVDPSFGGMKGGNLVNLQKFPSQEPAIKIIIKKYQLCSTILIQQSSTNKVFHIKSYQSYQILDALRQFNTTNLPPSREATPLVRPLFNCRKDGIIKGGLTYVDSDWFKTKVNRVYDLKALNIKFVFF